jgi:Na+/proline symporter
MDNGGFSEFAAVLGGVAAIAAVMSTIDSAVLALTNIFTQDFLRNWVFAAGARFFLTRIPITFGC